MWRTILVDKNATKATEGLRSQELGLHVRVVSKDEASRMNLQRSKLAISKTN